MNNLISLNIESDYEILDEKEAGRQFNKHEKISTVYTLNVSQKFPKRPFYKSKKPFIFKKMKMKKSDEKLLKKIVEKSVEDFIND